VRCNTIPSAEFIGNSRQSTEPASGGARQIAGGPWPSGRRLLQREGPLRDAGGGAAAGQDPAQLHGIDVTVSPVGSLVGLSVPPADQVRVPGRSGSGQGARAKRSVWVVAQSATPDEVEETPVTDVVDVSSGADESAVDAVDEQLLRQMSDQAPAEGAAADR